MEFETLSNEISGLIDQEEFEKALDIIDTQLHQDKYKQLQMPTHTQFEHWQQKWQLLLHKCTILEIKGKFTHVLSLADEIIEESKKLKDLAKKIHLAGLLAKIFPLFFLGRINENFQVINEALQLLDTLEGLSSANYERNKSFIVLARGLNTLYTSKFDQGLNDLKVSLNVLQQSSSEERLIGLGLLFKGMYFSEMGKYSRALDLLKVSSNYNKQRGLNYNYVLNLGHIANTCCEKGDLNRAKEYGEKALTLAKTKDNLFILGYIQRTLGRIFITSGDLQKAEEMFCEARKNWDLTETLHVYFPIAWLGLIYRMKGELDKAIESVIRGLKTIQQMGYKNAEGWALDYLGDLYREKGDILEALNYLNKALIVRVELDNKVDIARTLFNLFILTIDHKVLDEAKKYLDRLKHLNEELNIQIINDRTKLAEALMLMQSRNLLHIGHAQQKLVELTTTPNVEVSILILALLNLFDLLIIEWKATEDSGTLEDIHLLLKKLKNIAEDQKILPLAIENRILLANILLIEGKINQALIVLNEANEMAQRKKLSILVEKTSRFQKKLTQQIKEWQDLLAINASIAKRVEYSELLDYIKLAKQITSTY